MENWTLRGVYDADRVAELEEVYEGLGFKVLVMPLIHGAAPGCGECFKASPECVKVLYTKKIDSGTE